METIVIWPIHRRDWRAARQLERMVEPADPLGDDLSAAVAEHARLEADNIRFYESRVQGLMDEIFASVQAPAPGELPR